MNSKTGYWFTFIAMLICITMVLNTYRIIVDHAYLVRLELAGVKQDQMIAEAVAKSQNRMRLFDTRLADIERKLNKLIERK